MTSTNVQLLRALYATWVRGDWTSNTWADPEIEYVIADGPSPGSWKGLAGLAEGTRSLISVWEGWSAEADEYLELEDERVLVLVHVMGRGKRSGLDLEQMRTEAANLFHIRDGKVTRLVLYWERERAFADLGLPSEADTRSG